jgi:putative FmdB family regulatory protein
MPLYEYICQECDNEFELLVRGDEKPECPKCHSKKLERQLSVPARPRSESTSLPVGCDPNLPPCGPMCRRAQQS